MLLERDYSNADPRKSLPPIPVRVSRRSQLIAALRQNERPIVIEDQGLAGPFVRLLRVRELGRLGEFVANTMSSGIDQSYGANVEAYWYVGRYVLPGNVEKVILKPKPYRAGRPPQHGSITIRQRKLSNLNGSAVNVSRLTKPDWWQERLRSAPSARCGAALLILLTLGVPVHADDPIAEWLKQDESDERNDQVRPDLHALTDQQLQDIFKIGRDQEDSHELIDGGREQYPRLVYIWFVTIAAGFGAAIGTVKAMPFVVRRRLRTLASQWKGRIKAAATLRRTSVSKWFPAYLTQITCRLRRRPNPSAG